MVLEITESYRLDNNMDVLLQIKRLAKMGFKISIDDLDFGFSSITSIYKLALYPIKLYAL
ncbi:MAG: EAL domain-containing protein [Vibrionaceae bacterium]|nr:EAL domain-containing protein [Vibrionaceae bacterium]